MPNAEVATEGQKPCRRSAVFLAWPARDAYTEILFSPLDSLTLHC